MITIMKPVPMAHKTKIMLLVLCLALSVPMIAQAAANSTYYAVYCSNNKNSLSIKGGNHALLDCGGSASPSVETTVKSLSTDPKGAHAVTIVEADCYPDSATSSINNGRIKCSGGPPATLTLGKHFAASKKASASKKTSKKKKGGSKSGPTVPANINLSPINSGNLPQSKANSSTVQNIIRVIFGIIGAFALMSMTASGLKYITSGGDPGKTSEAKKGIIFALIGLMLAISAEAIVAFVVHRGAP